METQTRYEGRIRNPILDEIAKEHASEVIAEGVMAGCSGPYAARIPTAAGLVLDPREYLRQIRRE